MSADVQAVALDHVIARNVRELRVERGWRQSELAERMSAMGYRWSANRVAQVETLRRPVGLLELAALAAIFHRPLVDLLAGDEEVELPNGESVPLRRVRMALAEGKAEPGGGALNIVYLPSDEEKNAAARLGTDIGTVQSWALHLFGTTDIREARDRRAGDLSGLRPRSAQAKRGHAMREVIEEIRQAIEAASKKREKR